MRFLWDTAVFLYARGEDHAYREPCRDLLRAARDGLITGEASVEVAQEFAYVLTRRAISASVVRRETVAVMAAARLHAVESDDVGLMLDLMVRHRSLGPRDALHAATALRRGIVYIVSPDRAFDRVDDLTRLDPHAALAKLTAG